MPFTLQVARRLVAYLDAQPNMEARIAGGLNCIRVLYRYHTPTYEASASVGTFTPWAVLCDIQAARGEAVRA